MRFVHRSESCDRTGAAATEAMADRMARFHRVSWREALGGLVLPAVRLHRFRSAHHRALLDALDDGDCPPDETGTRE